MRTRDNNSRRRDASSTYPAISPLPWIILGPRTVSNSPKLRVECLSAGLRLLSRGINDRSRLLGAAFKRYLRRSVNARNRSRVTRRAIRLPGSDTRVHNSCRVAVQIRISIGRTKGTAFGRRFVLPVKRYNEYSTLHCSTVSYTNVPCVWYAFYIFLSLCILDKRVEIVYSWVIRVLWLICMDLYVDITKMYRWFIKRTRALRKAHLSGNQFEIESFRSTIEVLERSWIIKM